MPSNCRTPVSNRLESSHILEHRVAMKGRPKANEAAPRWDAAPEKSSIHARRPGPNSPDPTLRPERPGRPWPSCPWDPPPHSAPIPSGPLPPLPADEEPAPGGAGRW